MKRFLPLVATLFFLALGCKSTINTIKTVENIQISIQQDGKLIQPSKGVLALKKEAFDLIFEIPSNMGVFVNLSHRDSISKLTVQGKVPSVFDNSNVIAIDLFNRESTLYLTDDSINACYYGGEEEHTFNQITQLKGGQRGRRTITKIYDLNTSTSYEIKDMHDSIYLTFAGVGLAEQKPEKSFFIGQHIKIEWEE
jgi:hypothetical protein